ncbi:hypothetical protein [Streptomyces sp. NPDC056883]|uniref:hypothetical protein n=1 Tax=Streptomyces sp. NPDC056883 TaxID=3345959 RepID=UPI0036A42A1D
MDFRTATPTGIAMPTASSPVTKVTAPTTTARAPNTARVSGAPSPGCRLPDPPRANRTATTSTMSRARLRPLSIPSTGRPPEVAAGAMSPAPVTVTVPSFSTAPEAWWNFSQSVEFISPTVPDCQLPPAAAPSRPMWSKEPAAWVKRTCSVTPPRRPTGRSVRSPGEVANIPTCAVSDSPASFTAATSTHRSPSEDS